jgi:hypothetical protein
MGEIMSRGFKDVKDAKYSEGGVFFQPGSYLVRVDKVKLGETRKGKGFLVVETTILESDCPGLKSGAFCSWMIMEEWDTYMGYVKHFASVANEIEMDDVDEEGCDLMVSEENPCGGTLLRCVGVNSPGDSGKDFTKVKWSVATPADTKKWAHALPPAPPDPKQFEKKDPKTATART